MARPTLKEIAAACGVSVSTVSRVFSGTAPISEATRERIYSAARELGLDPAAARARQERTAIAFLVFLERSSGFENPFYLHSLQGAYDACRERGYDLVVHFSEENDPAMLEGLIHGKSVRGGIFSTVQTDEKSISQLTAKGFPFSVIGRPRDAEGTIWVDNDNFNASYTITAELMNRGYAKIAYIGKDLDYQFARDRYDGYRQAFSVRGFSHSEDLILIHRGDADFEEELQRFLARTRPDAVVADDDESALLCAGLCAEMNIRIKIVGFNYMPFPRIGDLDLELIDIRPRELGYWAARLLINRLEGREGPGHRTIPAGGLAPLP